MVVMMTTPIPRSSINLSHLNIVRTDRKAKLHS